MPHAQLRVWTERWDSGPVVGAEGEVDLATVDALRSVASRVVQDRPSGVIFDFRKVTHVDSSGLGVLVATRRRLGGASGVVTIVTDQPAVLHSLRITGLDRVFRVLSEAPAVSGQTTT